MALRYNPFDSAFRADPYPVYRRLRESDPVHRSPLGFWGLSRYEDVAAVQRDAGLAFFPPQVSGGLHEALRGEDAMASVARWLLFTDGELHRRFRGLMNPYFTPRSIAGIERLSEQEIARLFDGAPESGVVDLLGDVFRPLPVYVFCAWLGLPVEDRERCHAWAKAIGHVVVSVPTPQMIDDLAGPILECDAYFRDQIAQRRREPRDDLLTAMLDAEFAGEPVSDDELLSAVVFLLGTTYETTANMLGNAIVALLGEPEQLAALRADPGLMPGAVEELVRFDPPLQFHGRFANRPLEVGGRTIPEGSRVVLLIGAANRDPARYDDPDRLDLTRPDVRPLSFSGGPHYCLGANLARSEIATALRLLLDRYPSISPAEGDLRWRSEPLAIRGLESLPVRVGQTRSSTTRASVA